MSPGGSPSIQAFIDASQSFIWPNWRSLRDIADIVERSVVCGMSGVLCYIWDTRSQSFIWPNWRSLGSTGCNKIRGRKWILLVGGGGD